VWKVSEAQFDLEIWHSAPLTPIMLLGECVKLAEREGYVFFTIANWINEEHRNDVYIWFRTSGRITLHQVFPDTSEAVFRVTEIKPNVDIDSIKRKRLADRDEMVDRDLKAGLIY